jgi:hypothetical protein
MTINESDNGDGALLVPRNDDEVRIMSASERIAELEAELAAYKKQVAGSNQQTGMVISNPFQQSQQIQQYTQQLQPQSTDPRQRITQILTNPGELQRRFELTDQQADNAATLIAGLLTGGGGAAGYKTLKNIFGPEIATGIGGLIGGILGGYAGKKVRGK